MEERIVFVDSAGTPTGETGPKLASHTANTRLHLAFSCYIFRTRDNAFLLTQRALSKKVWPGVWTNSVCGHPMPGEPLEAAVRRRAQFELGLEQLNGIRCVVPKYSYKTLPYNGIIEHEFCPIFTAYSDAEPQPNSSEVEAYQWVTLPQYAQMLYERPEDMSYWAKDQFKHLKECKPFSSLLG